MSQAELDQPMCKYCRRSFNPTGKPKSEASRLLCRDARWSANGMSVDTSHTLSRVLKDAGLALELRKMRRTGRTCFVEDIDPHSGTPTNYKARNNIWGDPER